LLAADFLTRQFATIVSAKIPLEQILVAFRANPAQWPTRPADFETIAARPPLSGGLPPSAGLVCDREEHG
jgi:hypothetical protein